MSQEKYILVNIRDPGLPTHTWFWTKEKLSAGNHTIRVSPFFNSEKDAKKWMEENRDTLD